MKDAIIDYYSSKIGILDAELKRIKKVLSYLYLFRLLTFISFATLLVFFVLFQYNSLFLFFSLISFASFLISIKIDLRFDFKERFISNKLLLNKNELKILEYQYDERETGTEYNSLNPHLAADFDLFGKGSLFQYINRCSTKIGKTKLAECLCKSQIDEKIIIEKQKAIKELSEKNEFIQNFQSLGMLISESGNEITNLLLWLNQSAEKTNILQLFCIVLPLINAVWIGLLYVGLFSFNSIILPVLLSLSIILFNIKKINKAHSLLGKTAKTFKKYTSIIKLIEDEEFTSDYLCDVKKQLFHQNFKASNSLTSLFKLLNSFDFRLNMLVSSFLNILFIYDIQIYLLLGKWKDKNKHIVSSWFNALSDIDSLISFSVFAFNNENSISYPTISEKEFDFQAIELGHPLIPASVRICNVLNFSGTPSVIIITGANMAGKSTFLRALSVNLILAMNGAPVCAKVFNFTPCDIFSSIKIQDSLLNNESYFYAELVRLKNIIDHVKIHPKTIVFLDEILRGTNTKDKQTGSLGLLEKLIGLNSVVIIATHDLSIAELEKKYPEIVTNNCFEVELTNDQLIFDFKLKKGISQKLNASFLMKKLEIIN